MTAATTAVLARKTISGNQRGYPGSSMTTSAYGRLQTSVRPSSVPARRLRRDGPSMFMGAPTDSPRSPQPNPVPKTRQRKAVVGHNRLIGNGNSHSSMMRTSSSSNQISGMTAAAALRSSSGQRTVAAAAVQMSISFHEDLSSALFGNRMLSSYLRCELVVLL